MRSIAAARRRTLRTTCHLSIHRSPSRSPSVFPERTRDELIDSIVHTRTREHRAMPGFRAASSWEERRGMKIDCDKVYPGILLANGETIKNMDYLKSVGVTHVLNTAEGHVQVRVINVVTVASVVVVVVAVVVVVDVVVVAVVVVVLSVIVFSVIRYHSAFVIDVHCYVIIYTQFVNA